LAELVLAWARDIDTGEPRYIGEIDAEHRGAKCGCECPSCGLPLVAVNAARDEVQRRPHFRHPNGAQRADCAILAARSAALRLLTEVGVIELPRRRVSARVIGLSGAGHEAWAELPPEKVRVSRIDFKNRAFALLTLEDGRKLRVALTGSVGESHSAAEQVLVPTITIDIEESLAGLDEAAIRKRLQLLPDAICWRSHWEDAGLRAQADAKARGIAIEELDLPTDGLDIPKDWSRELQRETLLHIEVKRILERAGQIAVPGFEIVEEVRAAGMPTLQRKYSRDVCILELANTRLEQRVGHTVPDVLTEASSDHGQSAAPLLIEVTATNRIDEERTGRIQSLHIAALEIDLSLTGGRVTRTGLHHLVVHDVTLKKWIALPEAGQVRRELQQELRKEMEVRQEIERLTQERRARVQDEPLTVVAQRYLAAAERMFVILDSDRPGELENEAARHSMGACVEEMKWRGFLEAGNEDLLGHHRILSRLLSIRRDTGVGYRYRSGFEVLNAIGQSQDAKFSEWTLYLIAARVYSPMMNPKQRTWLDDWRNRVATAIRHNDFSFMRDGAYDRILGVLFPEMTDALSDPFGRRPQGPKLLWSEKTKRFERARHEPARHPARFPDFQGPVKRPLRTKSEGDLPSWFLRGAELEAWKKANPEYAEAWEPLLRRLGIS
jgi:hypothetical protein